MNTPTIPHAFGSAFTQIITQALSWSPDRCGELRARYDDARYKIGDPYDEADDTVYGALLDADLAEYDCDLSEDEVPAGWVERVKGHTGNYGVGQVAWAVLARDHDLIGDDDFETLTGWWTAAGLPMPERGQGRLLADKAARDAELAQRGAEVDRQILARVAAGERVPGVNA